MRALSIRQPWVWAILYAGKRVENREWRAIPRAMLGKTILLHAAARCTRTDYDGALTFMEERHLLGGGETRAGGAPSLDKLPRGAVVGRARLADAAWTDLRGHRVSTPGIATCMLCGATARKARCPKADPWAIPGTLGLLLDDVEPLLPVPFKGALGFFEVPDSALRGASRSW